MDEAAVVDEMRVAVVREVGHLVCGVAGVGEAPAGPGGAEDTEGTGDARRREFRVVLIKEGLAKSGRYYTPRVVETASAGVPLSTPAEIAVLYK